MSGPEGVFALDEGDGNGMILRTALEPDGFPDFTEVVPDRRPWAPGTGSGIRGDAAVTRHNSRQP